MIIHIGKCGGSNLRKKFIKLHNYDPIKHHCKSWTKSEKKLLLNSDHVVILLRDPIKRFLSIFYFRKSGRPEENVFIEFKNANELAESLNSENITIKKKALCCFNSPHLKYDFQYYINDEILDIIDKNKNIFIIRTEHYKEDFSKYYNYLLSKNIIKQNKFPNFFINIKNNTDKFNDQKRLSDKAIKNLKNIMKNDYSVLEKLCKRGLIQQTYIDNLM